MRQELTRRALLRGAGGATLALPLLESTARGAAAPGAPPLRLVIYVQGEGNLPKLWLPPKLANDALQLSEMLQPLSAHQQKLTVISGVSNKIAPLHTSNGHNAPGHTIMSAALVDTTGTGSFDKSVEVKQGSLSLGPVDRPLPRRSAQDQRADQLVGGGHRARRKSDVVQGQAGRGVGRQRGGAAQQRSGQRVSDLPRGPLDGLGGSDIARGSVSVAKEERARRRSHLVQLAQDAVWAAPIAFACRCTPTPSAASSRTSTTFRRCSAVGSPKCCRRATRPRAAGPIRAWTCRPT